VILEAEDIHGNLKMNGKGLAHPRRKVMIFIDRKGINKLKFKFIN